MTSPNLTVGPPSGRWSSSPQNAIWYLSQTKSTLANSSIAWKVSHFSQCFLGLTYMSRWTVILLHLDKVSKATARTLGVMQRNLHAAPPACWNITYQTLVRLKLEYVSTACSPQIPDKIRKLKYIQDKAARFMTHKYDHNTSLTGLKMSLNWPSLESQWDYKDSLKWYKIPQGLIHTSFPDSVSPKLRLRRPDHPLAYRQMCLIVEAYWHSSYKCLYNSTLERSACLRSDSHNPPSLPETGHIQLVRTVFNVHIAHLLYPLYLV